jgi:putative FmdB family regulatory protein
MPTYEYLCSSCGHAFERFQSMTEAPVKKCPECGKRVKRLMSGGAGILFKGTGFYHTDYKRGPAPKEAAKTDAAPKKEASPSKGPGKEHA